MTKAVRQKLLALVENTLLRFHTENPQQTGVSKSELMRLCDYRADTAGFDALLQEAYKDGRIVVAEGMIYHPQAGGGAKKLEEQAATKMFDILAESGTKPPFIPELINSSGVEPSLAYQALGSLEKQKLIRRINKELCFTTDAYDKLESSARQYLEQHGQATVAELKEAMESSRKYAVPLVEYFDDQGMTTRDGDFRRLR